MAVIFKFSTTRSDYSWMFELELNPSWDGINPAEKYLYDDFRKLYVPKNLDFNITEYEEEFFNAVNATFGSADRNRLFDNSGNPSLYVLDANGNQFLIGGSPVFEVKDWSYPLIGDSHPNSNFENFSSHTVNQGQTSQNLTAWSMLLILIVLIKQFTLHLWGTLSIRSVIWGREGHTLA